MAKSIMQSEKVCYVTGTPYGLDEHHVIGGPYRSKSDKYGLTVWLRRDYHTGTPYAVHNKKSFRLQLRKEAQRVFEKKYSHELFMKEFGHDYLAGDTYDDES